MVGQPSGVGASCRGLVEALLADDEVELSAYAIARRAFQARREVPREVKFRGRPLPAPAVQVAWQSSRFPPAELFVRRSDVLHGTNFVVPPSTRSATVVTVHDLTALRYPELCTRATLRYPGLVRAAAQRGAVVHVPSSFVRSEVLELLELDEEIVKVVGWAVPPVAEPMLLPLVEPPFILALGTVEPRKDYPTLVEAFNELAAEDETLRLVIAGADGWGADALSRAVSARRLEDRVVRLGYVSDEERNSLLWHAAVLAYPSLYEGFGFPPLEAMTAGVPVVATRAGAVPEVVGDAALLVEARDAGGLAAGLREALRDRQVRDRLVVRGREHVSHLSWQRTAREMIEVYSFAAERSTS